MAIGKVEKIFTFALCSGQCAVMFFLQCVMLHHDTEHWFLRGFFSERPIDLISK